MTAGHGNVVPLHILDIAAAVADEVVMFLAFGFEAGGAATDGELTHEIHLYQFSQIVIGCGARTARVEAVYGFEDFRSGVVPLVLHQKCHDAVALWSAAETALFQREPDGFCVDFQV